MTPTPRGFALLPRARQRALASKGGRAAHRHGTAHEWTIEEARAAGRKGGSVTKARRQAPARQERAS